MTRTVHWSQRSRAKLRAITAYIAERNVAAARELRQEIEDAAQRAASETITLRKGRLPGTREIVVTRRYVLVFRSTAKRIYVVNILDTRQRNDDQD